MGHIHDLRVVLVELHVVLPELIDCLEELGLLWKLLLDILCVEDVFEVHPLSLES